MYREHAYYKASRDDDIRNFQLEKKNARGCVGKHKTISERLLNLTIRDWRGNGISIG